MLLLAPTVRSIHATSRTMSQLETTVSFSRELGCNLGVRLLREVLYHLVGLFLRSSCGAGIQSSLSKTWMWVRSGQTIPTATSCQPWATFTETSSRCGTPPIYNEPVQQRTHLPIRMISCLRTQPRTTTEALSSTIFDCLSIYI
jgi:hypothetical protein